MGVWYSLLCRTSHGLPFVVLLLCLCVFFFLFLFSFFLVQWSYAKVHCHERALYFKSKIFFSFGGMTGYARLGSSYKLLRSSFAFFFFVCYLPAQCQKKNYLSTKKQHHGTTRCTKKKTKTKIREVPKWDREHEILDFSFFFLFFLRGLSCGFWWVSL